MTKRLLVTGHVVQYGSGEGHVFRMRYFGGGWSYDPQLRECAAGGLYDYVVDIRHRIRDNPPCGATAAAVVG